VGILDVKLDVNSIFQSIAGFTKLFIAFLLGVAVTIPIAMESIENTQEEQGEQTEEYKEAYEEYKSAYQDLNNSYYELRNQESTIPETPAISSLDYRLYGYDENEQEVSQIALEYPGMFVQSPSGTGSMSPGISSQSMIIFTTEFDERTLTPGQIVSYNVEGRESNIVHRVHDVESQEDGGICYIMKGDANPRVDGECVEPENMEYLALGTIFRKTGDTSICREELQYGPESQYCPS
jgi:signal peptidase I